ncbi:MAG: murein hydrolase activator EnvC family protein [Bacillaceae bacterium]
MKNKIISSTLVGVISFATLAPFAPSVLATSSLNNQLNDVKEKQDGVQTEKEKLQEKLNKTKNNKADVEAQLEKLKLSIQETKEKSSAVYSEMAKIKAEIRELEKEISDLKERIERRTEILKERLVSLQKTGGRRVSYIEVILGAESFANLIDRIHGISRIMKSDQDILREQENDQRMLEKKTVEQKKQLAKVEKEQAKLEKLSEQLQEQSEKQKELMKQLEQEEEHIEGYLMDIEEEAQVLQQQEETIKLAIAEEKRRQEEQKRKEEEERRKQELAQQQQQNNNNKPSTNTPTTPENNENSGSKPPISSGIFTRPATGPVTSEFGPRWGKNHHGIDIGKRGASVPIVAAADGVVSSSYYSSSYGNVVFITHYINGQVYTTIYAHMENRAVQAGESVSKGDFLGYMGNTGFSTGPHLHFEIHEGEWNNAKSNAVNPRKYINF